MSEVKLLEKSASEKCKSTKWWAPVHALRWQKLESSRQGKQLVAGGQIIKVHAECL